jgi:hypothetical protein
MANPEIEKRVLQLVRDHWKGANVREIQINDRLMRFFHGSLYVVSIYDANNEEHENYVYADGDELRRYDDLRQLGGNIGASSRFTETLYEIFQFVGISGIIAIVITVTICWLVLTRGSGYLVPDHLANALYSILGFYFGTTVRRSPR